MANNCYCCVIYAPENRSTILVLISQTNIWNPSSARSITMDESSTSSIRMLMQESWRLLRLANVNGCSVDAIRHILKSTSKLNWKSTFSSFLRIFFSAEMWFNFYEKKKSWIIFMDFFFHKVPLHSWPNTSINMCRDSKSRRMTYDFLRTLLHRIDKISLTIRTLYNVFIIYKWKKKNANKMKTE